MRRKKLLIVCSFVLTSITSYESLFKPLIHGLGG